MSFSEWSNQKKKKNNPTSSFSEWSNNKHGKTDEEEDIAPIKQAATDKKKEEDEKWYEGWFQKGNEDVGKATVGTITDATTDATEGGVGILEGVIDWFVGLAPYLAQGMYYANGGGYNIQADQAFRQSIDTVKAGTEKFIAKDLIDEEAVAKNIVSGLDSAVYYANLAQSGAFATPEQLAIGQQMAQETRKYLDTEMEEDSVFAHKTDELMKSAGQLAGTAALSAVGVPWWAVTGATSWGGEVENALKQGASLEEANLSGAISASAEILTEKISGGIKFGGNTLDDVLTKRLAANISSKFWRNAAKLGIDVVGEGLEEVMSEDISRFGQWLTYQDEKTLEEMLWSEEAMDAKIQAFISGGALGGGGSVTNAVKSTASGVDAVSGLTKNEQAVVDKVVQDKISEAKKSGKKADKTKIYDEVLHDMERGFISTEEIESVLGGESYKAYKDTVEIENALLAQQKALQDEYNALNKMAWRDMTGEQFDRRDELKTQLAELKTKIEETQKNSQRSQLKSKLGKEVFAMVKDSRLVESYNEHIRSTQDLDIDVTKYDGVARKTIENAIKSGANNSNRVRDFVELSAKAAKAVNTAVDFGDNKKVNAVLENQLAEQINELSQTPVESRTSAQVKELAELQEMLQKVKDGKITVNGVKTKDGILINTQSAKALDFILGHEVTHKLEKTEAYKELQKSLFDYAESLNDLQGRRSIAEKLYKNIKGTTADQELTSDLAGEYLFSDYDFVKNFAFEHRNAFQKVLDQIKYWAKVATAGSKEARQLEKAKKLYEDALQELARANAEQTKVKEANEFGDTDTQYSIREEAPPKKTIKGYKVFKVVDGKLYPPMVDNPSGNGTPVGVWLNADIGGLAHNKDGSVKLNTKGRFAVESSQGGSLAFRPGWHLGEYPDASQFGRMDTSHPLTDEELATYEGKTYTDKNGNVYPMNLFPYNFVWAECDVAADHDYQLDAMSLGVNAKGSFVRTQAGLPYVPTDGYYKYRTNADPNTAPWIISGAIKVNRILDDADVAEICAQHGVTPQTREGFTNLKIKDGGTRTPGNAIDLANFGLARGDVVPTDANALAEISMADGVAKERSATAMGLLKTLPGYAKRKINFSDKKIIKEFAMNNQDVEYYRELAKSTNDGYLADDNLYSDDGVQYSLAEATDKDYLDAVNRGDTETAQKMVDEAAKKAGYTRKLYHGTASNFNVFGFGRTGIFTTDNFDMAKTYGDNVISLYGKEGANVLTIDAQESPHYAIKVSKDVLDFSEYPLMRGKELYSTNDISLIAFREGYDVVVIENVYDNYSIASDNNENGLGTDVVYKDSNQVKSSEPVTYDDSGNVIPLSQRFNAENNDIRYSLSDSDGRQLSDGQQEFFKDSKMRDENGNLKVMYHGTPNGDFTVFKDGTYFTDNKEYADRYQNPGASSISSGKTASNPKTFEVYLDIKKPFDIKDAEARRIYIEEYIKGGNAMGINPYLSDAEYDNIKTIDWTEGEDLRDFLIENDYDYDGLVLDEGGTGGYGDDVQSRGKSYVVFSPEQVKDVDNLNPTSDPDIRFSLSEAVEETKDLFAVHNLQSSELAKTLELGGLPMPSIAVIKASQGHEAYGDVSLIFPKDTIDPKASSANKVYGGDAWTPTYPRTEYKPNKNVQKRIKDKYYELAEKFGYDDLRPLYRYVSELESELNGYDGEAGLLDALYSDDRMMQVYLQDSGKGKVEPVIKETRTEATEAEKEMNQWFIDRMGEDVIRAFKAPAGVSPFTHRTKFMEQYGELAEQAYRDLLVEKFDFSREDVEGVLDQTERKDILKFIRNAEVYLRNGGVTVKAETDYEATKKAIVEKSADGYKEWVDNLFKGIEEKSGIRNNLDAFTSSGNRRSWDALHWENTLENVVKAMKGQDETGVGSFSPYNSFASLAQKRYGSIAEIKADSDRLGKVSEEEYEAMGDSFANRLAQIADSIKNPNERNPFIATDEAAELIVDTVRSQKTKSGMLRYMQKWNNRVTESTVDDIVSLVNDIANMPTGYFEAKPKRAVRLDEVGVFVIPNNADVKLKQELLNRGYSIAEYDPNVEGDRQRVVNQFEEYKFSLSDASEPNTQIGGNHLYGKDFGVKSPDDIAPYLVENEATAPVGTNAPVNDDEVTDEPPSVANNRADVESVIGGKDSFVSKQAMELYNEISNLKKGVRASKRLGYLLDHGYEWRSIKTALLNIKDNPNQVVNPNSAAESVAREMLGREYDAMVEDFANAQGVTGKIFTKMQNLGKELENNKRLREQSSEDFDGEIARLQAEYDVKKNKNTKVANDLLRRIERTQRMKANVDADYGKRISDLESRIEKMSKPGYKTAMQRRAKHNEYSNLVANLVGDTSTWVDKKLGLSYKVNTLRRNLRDVVRDANGNKDIAKADAIYDELQGKYNHNEAELKRESMRIKEVFQKLNLNHTEDTYAHMLGEFRHNPDTKLTEETVKEFYEKHKSIIDTKKVDTAIEESRKVFDDLIVRVNERLREQGMKEIPYRQGYFPHFTNPKQGWLAKLLNWKTVDTEIPTSIAGLTETFNPERSWQGFSKQRKGDTTDYSLEQGLDTYIHGALDWIYHIEDIQKRRALENHIRYVHSEEGVKARIDAINSSEELDADEAQRQIDAVYAEANNPLNNFVTNLRAGTNTLANKKSENDRQIESDTNRKIYSVMTNLNNRINANMVVGSFSSALTNFIPITQSWMEVSPVYSLKGMRDTIISTIRDDGMVNKSDFLTNRLMNEENLYQTAWDKVADKAGILMEAIDSFTSQTVWRSKYLQNISEGMSETEAIKNADQFAENVIAGRSRGNQPTIFDAKNPITKIFTAFQLEVANQYGYMFKDAPQDSANKARLVKGYATAFLGAYAYNALYSSLVGRDAAFDPISILEDLFKDLFGDDDEKEEPGDAFLNLVDNVLEEVPFVGGLLGGGRIPISSIMPYSGEYEGLSGFVSDVSEGDWEKVTKEMLSPLYYLAMPVGGGQIKKTVEGLGMFSDDHPVAGSYTDSGSLRFPVEDTFWNRTQAALFGQYANKNARDYFDNERSPLKEKQIQEYIDVDLPIRDYWEYREGLSEQETLEDKFDYIAGLDLPVAKKNILINNIVDRKEPVDMEGYEDFSGYEEFDFATKNPEKYEFFEANGVSFKEYQNADEDEKRFYSDAFEVAKKSPAKVTMAKAVSDSFVEFYRLTRTANSIKGVDLNGDGKTDSGSKKANVYDYIFSLDLDYGQKVILYRSMYDSKSDKATYNMDIVNYLNSRDDISYEEMVAILEELDFTVNGNNVSW